MYKFVKILDDYINNSVIFHFSLGNELLIINLAKVLGDGFQMPYKQCQALNKQ